MKKPLTLLLAGMFACLCASSSADANPDSTQSVVSNLYIAEADGTTVLMDGALTQYDSSYSNAIDGLDARKMSNFTENLGLIRGTTTLVIERRHTIEVTDTIFYKIWNLRQQTNYRLEFLISGLNQPGLSGFVEDLYLHTQTPVSLNGSNYVNFTINADTASSNMYRFRIIFYTPGKACKLPFAYTCVKAFEEKEGVSINWQTTNENNVENYFIEKSDNGKSYATVGSLKANNTKDNSYDYLDANPEEGNNYYRIRSTTINGEIAYSDVMKVYRDKGIAIIKIFPNPVAGNNIHLQMVNQPAGEYEIRLINNFGQAIYSTKIQHPGGSNTLTISPAQHIPRGIYRLEITKPGGNTSQISVIY